MILEKETFEKYGYYPTNLSKYPERKIIVKCDRCNKIREILIYNYSGLCKSCSCITNERWYALTEEDVKCNKKMTQMLEVESYNKFGYYPSDLKYKSFKRILVKCEKCGKVREINKLNYRNQCKSCIRIGIKFTEEHKQKMKENHYNQNGKDNPNWQGGKSFEPYCEKFDDKIKEKIRDEFNRKCFICDKSEIDNNKRLSIHHIDYNKKQGCDEVNWKLIPLCQSCHAKTNFDRDYWENLITQKLENKNIL